MYEKPETRDGVLKTNPKGKYDENVNVMDEKQLYEKPEKRNVMDYIIDTVMLNTEYKAGIKVPEAGSATWTRSLRQGMGCSRPTTQASTART
jgi:hypothetical protein